MTEFGLVEPFETDGLADVCDQEHAFALGVEWAMFRQRLLSGNRFTCFVLANNTERLVKMAERHRRYVEHRPTENGWALITVGDYVV